MRIKMNDNVVVITGDDRGTQGKVIAVDHEKGKVTVEGVNRVYKHVRRSQRNPQGGRLSKEMPVQISNVALYCNKCGKGVRVGLKYTDDGSKLRVCKKCGNVFDQVAPPRAAHAKK